MLPKAFLLNITSEIAPWYYEQQIAGEEGNSDCVGAP